MTHPGFRIAAAYAYAEAHGLADEAAKIRSMPIHPSIPKPSAVRKGCLVDLFEKNGVIDDFVAKLWPLRNTPTGDNRYKHFM